MPMNTIKLGRYRHYKGPEYEVLNLARHSETDEWHVVYRQCYGDEGIWIRPLTMFTETVDTDSGQVGRFQYIGDD